MNSKQAISDSQEAVEEEIKTNSEVTDHQMEEINANSDARISDARESLIEEINATHIPEDVMDAINEKKAKLEELDIASSDYENLKYNLDYLTNMPWGKTSLDNEDIELMRKVLDEDMVGMKDLKKQILQFIECEQQKTGKILLFCGSSGIGKTTMAKSIARALGRKFCEFSVECGKIIGSAAIKGGVGPGKFVECLYEAQTENPVIVINVNEIESASDDFLHDFFKALNPEENYDFGDRFLDVPVDLSKVLFILTSTDRWESIQRFWKGRLGPLRNRMVPIEFWGYAAEEKIKIAKEHFIPKLEGKYGLMDDKLKMTDDAIAMIIKFYCYEAGVKKLEEYLENIYLVAKKRLEQGPGLERGKVKEPLVVNEGILENFFGPKLFNKLPYDDGKTQPGMIMGLLSSFSLGGSFNYIEADINIGSVEKLKIVGVSNNGVKESIEIAYKVAKNVLKRHDPENNFFDQFNVIVQFEFEGTGNSAGTSFVSVFLSLALNLPIRGIAMTGSISVRGRVLAVGGIKDKLDAAKHVGIPLVILPEDNREDYDEMEEFIKEGIDVEFASDYGQIFHRIFPDFKPKRAKMDSSIVAQFYE